MDGRMIIPKIFNEEQETLSQSGEDLRLRHIHAILGWNGTAFISLKDDYAYALEHELPFVSDCECVFLICGDNSYWKRHARIAVAISEKPLSKITGLKKAGVSERGGVVDLSQIIESATGEDTRTSATPGVDRYDDRNKVFCYKVTALHRIRAVDQDSDDYATENLRFIAQVRTLLKWVGAEGHLSDGASESAAEVLQVPEKRLLALKKFIASSENVDELIYRMVQPKFLAQHLEFSRQEAMDAGAYDFEDWRRLKGLMSTSEELESQGVSLGKTKSGYYSPAYSSLNYVIKNPDVYWLRALEYTERLAGETDFKSRKKDDREAKKVVRGARTCSLRSFRDLVLRDPCMFRVHVMAGEILDEVVPDIFKVLEYFSSKIVAEHGSAKLSRVIKTLKFTLDACSPEVRDTYTERLEEFVEGRYAAINEFCDLVKSDTWVRDRDVASTVFDLVIELEKAGFSSKIGRLNLLTLAAGLDCDVVGGLSPRYLALVLRN